MKYYFLSLFLFPIFLGAQPRPDHNLVFNHLPLRWDEGLPLGNGWLGCLIWEKEGAIRLSLDRADLWDLRPMAGLDRPEFNYQWVARQVAQGDYSMVQQYFDAPYEREAGPSKLPGAALQMMLQCGDWQLGKIRSSELNLENGLATVLLDNGLRLRIFVHAERPEGWFRLDYPEAEKNPASAGIFPGFQIIPPAYDGDPKVRAGGSVAGDDLARLGYRQGEVKRISKDGDQPEALRMISDPDIWVYDQEGWNGFRYQVALTHTFRDLGVEGVWSISSHFPEGGKQISSKKTVQKAIKRGFERSFRESAQWWSEYWSRSSIRVPDTLLERQYYRDMYKFGCVARSDAPMISLQGVWTADNGRLPPWKGDFHHDLNTQMSYWPAYTANHLDLAAGYLNHLERNEKAHRRYTKHYFGTDGLNVPGVETLSGEPMGGWIQYACSPTTSAWLAHHFYLQWQYSQDRHFLKKHAWPWLQATARHLEQLSHLRPDSLRVLPLSSSPEFFDNSRKAWFTNTWSNYDLALARFIFYAARQAAEAVGNETEVRHWATVEKQLPPFATESNGALEIAPSLPYRESHRHFSHLLSIYPLAMFDRTLNFPYWDAMKASLQLLDSIGTSGWTGYSFAWQAALRAQLYDGNGARDALRIFAEAFVSPNSFHLNGDQSGKGYSAMTYRPFTLEGNFASAAALQEMLLQSHGGMVTVFPAIPPDWKDGVSFQNLRTAGAFLVDAEIQYGKLKEVRVKAERDALLLLVLPTRALRLEPCRKCTVLQDITPVYNDPDRYFVTIKMQKGGVATFN